MNTDFTSSIKLDYFFEKKQFIKFSVFDVDGKEHKLELIGESETIVSKIMADKK